MDVTAAMVVALTGRAGQRGADATEICPGRGFVVGETNKQKRAGTAEEKMVQLQSELPQAAIRHQTRGRPMSDTSGLWPAGRIRGTAGWLVWLQGGLTLD